MPLLQPEPTSTAPQEEVAVCAKLLSAAQRELAAFLGAVVSLFGSEQATLAAEAWMAELLSVDNITSFTARDWRLITVAALSHIADHLAVVRSRRASASHVETAELAEPVSS